MTPEQLAKLQKSSAAARAKFQATYAAAQKPATSGMSATSTGSTGSIPSSQGSTPGYKTVYLQSGGNVVVGPDGTISQYGGKLNDSQMSALGKTGVAGDFNSNLEKEYKAGKILNTFDFVPGKGTQWDTGTTDYSPFAVDLKTAARNAGQIPLSASQASAPASKGSIPSYGSNINNYTDSNAAQKQIADLGQQWAKATTQAERDAIHNQATAIGQAAGGTYNAATGTWSFPTTNNVGQGSPTNVTSSGGYIPPNAVTNIRSSSDLQQLAQDNTAQERAALLRSITDQVANVKNSAQYANQLIQDNRTLEDQSLLRNLNPFNGRTGYQLAQVQRGRSIDDTSRAATLENQLNSINQELTDFDKLTPERQREIYNQLLTMERDFGLNAGQLTGNYGGQQTLAARTADQNYGLNYAGQFGTLPGNSQGASGSSAGAPITLAAQNQAFNQNMATQQFDFQKSQQEWENLFNQAQFDESKAARIWEQAFKDKSFAQDVKEAAASRGLQWASLDQRQKEFVADQAFRDKQFEFEQQQYNDKLNAEPDSSYSGMTPKQIMDSIKSQYTESVYGAPDPLGNQKVIGERITTDPAKREQMFLQVVDSGLPDADTDQVLTLLGLTKDEIKQFTSKYAK